MGRFRPTRILAGCLLLLACVAMLFGCGGEEEPAVEADLIRPPGAGKKCDQTWQGPTEDEEVAATLFLNRRVVRPGGTLWAAIENRGTEELTYGVAPMVKRQIGETWVGQPFPGMDFPLLALTIDPRTLSTCIEIPVPKSWKPGLYRVNFEVSARGSVDQIEGPGFPSYFRVR